MLWFCQHVMANIRMALKSCFQGSDLASFALPSFWSGSVCVMAERCHRRTSPLLEEGKYEIVQWFQMQGWRIWKLATSQSNPSPQVLIWKPGNKLPFLFQ